MKTRNKKLLSILLATAMVFTMNTFAFAEEVAVDEFDEVVAVDSVDDVLEASDVAFVDEFEVEDVAVDAETPSDNTVTPNAISGDKVLSENLAEIDGNLHDLKTTTVGDYFIVFPTSVAFGGKDKPGSKNFPISVRVFKAKAGATVSYADLVSWNDAKGEAEITSASFDEISVKKATIKAAKGATVKLDGSPLYEAKKATYIKSIKLADKTENRAFQAATKNAFKDAKKSTEKVSANGYVDGKLVSSAWFSIAVYPCYAGNDDTAVKEAQAAGLEVINSIDTAKSKWDKGKIKVVNADGKKATLSLTKKAGKYKGLAEKKTDAVATDNSKNATEYYVADGNYAGNIYKF